MAKADMEKPDMDKKDLEKKDLEKKGGIPAVWLILERRPHMEAEEDIRGGRRTRERRTGSIWRTTRMNLTLQPKPSRVPPTICIMCRNILDMPKPAPSSSRRTRRWRTICDECGQPPPSCSKQRREVGSWEWKRAKSSSR